MTFSILVFFNSSANFFFTLYVLINFCYGKIAFCQRLELFQVIVEKAPKARIRDLDKKKYLVPSDLTVGKVAKIDEFFIFIHLLFRSILLSNSQTHSIASRRGVVLFCQQPNSTDVLRHGSTLPGEFLRLTFFSIEI